MRNFLFTNQVIKFKARSQSDQRIRILGNAKSPKNLREYYSYLVLIISYSTNENKIQLQNILSDISITGNRSMKNNNSHWTPINVP